MRCSWFSSFLEQILGWFPKLHAAPVPVSVQPSQCKYEAHTHGSRHCLNSFVPPSINTSSSPSTGTWKQVEGVRLHAALTSTLDGNWSESRFSLYPRAEVGNQRPDDVFCAAQVRFLQHCNNLYHEKIVTHHKTCFVSVVNIWQLSGQALINPLNQNGKYMHQPL
jgi:hypothetical protein